MLSNRNEMLKTIIIALIFGFLSGCSTTAGDGSPENIYSDRRSLGAIIDDSALYLDIHQAIEQDERLKDAHLNFLTHDAKVLVTGEVANKEHKALIDKLIAEYVPQVKVINETQIGPPSTLLARMKDGLITIKVDISFYNQEVFYPAHVRVTTENRTVYLMGTVTEREANEAVRTVKEVSGVKKIVKVFEYLKSRPITEIKAEERYKLAVKKIEENDKKRQLLEKKNTLIKAEQRQIQKQIDKLDATKKSVDPTSF